MGHGVHVDWCLVDLMGTCWHELSARIAGVGASSQKPGAWLLTLFAGASWCLLALCLFSQTIQLVS